MSSPVASFAANLTQTILAAASATDREVFAVGVVTDVTSGQATVTWHGGSYTVKRLSTYTPVVDDVVLMARPRDQLVILAAIV